MTKQEEARFHPTDLADLSGSTAAKSRKMNLEERDIMLHKRRLRNRASAARSRDKQRKTINELGDEVDDLLLMSQQLLHRCLTAEKNVVQLREANSTLVKENMELKANQAVPDVKAETAIMETKVMTVPPPPQAPPLMAPAPSLMAPAAPNKVLKRTTSMLRVSMSSDMLDKIMNASTSNGVDLTTGMGGGLMKIASKLHLSLSTDRLSDGESCMPFMSGSLPPLSRNVSVMERLLDFANNNGNAVDIDCDVGVANKL